jgi:uncharacterized SAM-binding protein YcdF (DUF218 family)
VIRRIVGIVLVVVLTVGAVATAGLFVWPRTRTTRHADAVVMFVGGKGERLDTALRLVRAGIATNLVIPNGTKPTWPQANRLCSGGTSFKVWCPTPDPDTTRGEARAIAALAKQQGWRHVAAVTSRYHVARARLLLSRCFSGDIDPVAAGPGLTLPRYAARVSHEWAGMAEALLVNRGC